MLTIKDRYISNQDGTPFFYLGDTAWELFHCLNRDETAEFMRQRARQGFTAIQAVALSEFEGITTPNAYGRLPLLCTNGVPNPDKPDTEGAYSYWDHVDYAVETAEKNGLFMAMVITWGDKFNICWGKGPEIFNAENGYRYAKWIAERYRDKKNIIWVLGGDRPLEPAHRAVIDAMGKAIREADPSHLITFHPPGAMNSTQFVNDADYIDFHTAQTGHGIEKCFDSDGEMLSMKAASEKPYLDSEPRYESHPACFKTELGYLWQDYDVRQNAYWNVFTGACGHTYGNHCIWSMNRIPTAYFPFTWQQALLQPGAEQIGFIKKLRYSRDYFSFRHAPEILPQNYSGMGHMVAGCGKGYAYIYSPLGIPFEINLDFCQGVKQYKASWFDPRTGEEKIFSILPATGKTHLVPPTSGVDCDWVLIIDAE